MTIEWQGGMKGRNMIHVSKYLLYNGTCVRDGDWTCFNYHNYFGNKIGMGNILAHFLFWAWHSMYLSENSIIFLVIYLFIVIFIDIIICVKVLVAIKRITFIYWDIIFIMVSGVIRKICTSFLLFVTISVASLGEIWEDICWIYICMVYILSVPHEN